MKASSSSSRIIFRAALALSLVCALHKGLVLAITAPRLPSSNHIIGSESRAPLGSLGVDEEGNLLWSKNKNNNHEGRPSSEAESSSTHSKQSRSSPFLLSLRGGNLSVDGEGNFYTPRRPTPPATTKKETATQDSPLSPTTEALRGGSNNNPRIRADEIRVDSEGNLFFDSASSSAITTAATLRGGELCVDNEGNFFSPRKVAPAEEQVIVPVMARRRRSRNDDAREDQGAVVLAKNERVSASPKDSNNKPSKKDKDETPMAFIGYNNALMET